jgi:hypothetical protein
MVKEKLVYFFIFPCRRMQKCGKDVWFMNLLKVYHLLPLSGQQFGTKIIAAKFPKDIFWLRTVLWDNLHQVEWG